MFRAMMVVDVCVCVLCGVGYATMRVQKIAAGEMDVQFPPELWDGQFKIIRYAVRKNLSRSPEDQKMVSGGSCQQRR